MNGIIDIHTHLGDILFSQGGSLIEKKGVARARGFDISTVQEFFLWREMWWFYRPLGWSRVSRLIIESGILRNNMATRENLEREMARSGIISSVTLPIYPRVTFNNLHAAQQANGSLLPFTGVDFDQFQQTEEKLASDVAAGARGLKLHPILQKEHANSDRTRTAVEIFGQYRLPVLLHTGVCYYYLDPAHHDRQEPDNGQIDGIAALIADFPDVPFIVGHAGLNEHGDVGRLLGGRPNVWVDISFQPVPVVREMIAAFGPERVLFASDWPFGNIKTMLRIVDKAVGGDAGVRRRILHDNAAELLRL